MEPVDRLLLIGYWKNRDDVRVRRRFYFGNHKASAIRQSIQTQQKWRKVVEEQRAKDEAQKRIDPNHKRTPPCWPQDHIVNGSPRIVGDKKIINGQHTVMQAAELFLAAKKAEVGLAGGVGIKATTVNGLNSSLRLALGLSIGKETFGESIRMPIDVNMLMTDLVKSDIELFRNFWMALPKGKNIDGPISVRTAINYCLTFKSFLNWADSCDELGFDKPKGVDDLFNFKGMKKSKVEKYDPEKLKALFNFASEKTALYLLLALNCGHYQADIGSLMQSELRVINGEPFLYRKRTKMTDVAEEEIGVDEDGEQHVLSYLWPETYALLQKYRAPEGNPLGRLLLNERGTPLWYEETGKMRRDAITPAV